MDEHEHQQHRSAGDHCYPDAQGHRRGLGFAQLILHFELEQRHFLPQQLFGVVHEAAQQRSHARLEGVWRSVGQGLPPLSISAMLPVVLSYV